LPNAIKKCENISTKCTKTVVWALLDLLRSLQHFPGPLAGIMEGLHPQGLEDKAKGRKGGDGKGAEGG